MLLFIFGEKNLDLNFAKPLRNVLFGEKSANIYIHAIKQHVCLRVSVLDCEKTVPNIEIK